jgi:hypothetical protein
VATSFFALLDDLAALLDDVAVLTKVAAKKTAGVLGDDLALNAEQVGGFSPDRELPVVWAVAKGSAVNKVILVPAALLLSAISPIAITGLLLVGGAFLCYEGVEKLAEKFLHPKTEEAELAALRAAVADETVDLAAVEKEKIRGAIRTDFVLSAELIVIALGSVGAVPFLTRVLVLSAVAVAMTVGVYGLVAAIVKIDDLGLALQRRGGALGPVGAGLVRFAPSLMKGLSVAGTIAVFLVGGGIFSHNVPVLHHASEAIGARAGAVGTSLFDGVVGVVLGIVLVALAHVVKSLRPTKARA